MDDVSMSPDSWANPAVLSGAERDLTSTEYARAFPTEQPYVPNLNNNQRQLAGEQPNSKQRPPSGFQPVQTQRQTNDFGTVPLPPRRSTNSTSPLPPIANHSDRIHTPQSSAPQLYGQNTPHIEPPNSIYRGGNQPNAAPGSNASADNLWQQFNRHQPTPNSGGPISDVPISNANSGYIPLRSPNPPTALTREDFVVHGQGAGTLPPILSPTSVPPMTRRPRRRGSSQPTWNESHNQQGSSSVNTFGFPIADYRPELGHRNMMPTDRGANAWDRGSSFDFEKKKKDYPPMSEILSTGTYFGSVQTALAKPFFQSNTAISTANGGNIGNINFDFDYAVAPSFRAGFESKYGPGIQISYAQYDHGSETVSFFSDGITTGQTSVWLAGPNRFSRLEANAAGDQLTATHGLQVHQYGVAFFKDLKFPIAKLNGQFGMEYVNIAHSTESVLTNGGATLGTLRAESDMKAFGPQVMFEYFRPVGHTKLTLVTHFGGAILLGNRDQFVSNTLTGDFISVGADELITKFDFGSSLVYKWRMGEKRFVKAALGFDSQSWIGGGNALLPQGDFGFRAITFNIGYNR